MCHILCNLIYKRVESEGLASKVEKNGSLPNSSASAREWIGFSLPSERNPICEVRHDWEDAQLLPTTGYAVPGKTVGIVAVGEIVDA